MPDQITITDLMATIGKITTAPMGLGKMTLAEQALCQAGALFTAYDRQLSEQRVTIENQQDRFGRLHNRIAGLEAEVARLNRGVKT